MVKSHLFYCKVNSELQSEFFNNLTTMTKNFTVLTDIDRILHFYTFLLVSKFMLLSSYRGVRRIDNNLITKVLYLLILIEFPTELRLI